MSALTFKLSTHSGGPCPDCPRQRSVGRYFVHIADWPVMHDGRPIRVCKKCRDRMIAEWDSAREGERVEVAA